MKNPTTQQLANQFSKVLHEWLTLQEMEQVIALNKNEANSHVCHSHDFCDANEAMAEALESLGIEWDGHSDEQIDLWNSAWDLAKDNDFKF